MTAPAASLHDSFNIRDNPTPEFIQAIRDRFPVEREVDELLTRKMQNRAGPPYRRITLEELEATLTRMLTDLGVGNFTITEPGWFTGGVSKIQMGFTLEWDDPAQGRRKERLVLRMDPSEGSNTTSRPREYELLEAFQDIIPVPAVYWLDPDGRWFPQPALIYAFAPGVTKSRTTQTGQVSGLGTNFGPDLRAKLAPQFMAHLAAIHHFDFSARSFATMDMPQAGTTQAALWQLNRARRIWEEDRGEDFPLMVDCYMSLTPSYAIDLAEAARHLNINWWEEALHPGDVEGFRQIKAAHPAVKWTTGEHEYTRYGFRRLIEERTIDILQPDVMWVGGLTELLRIAAHAGAYDIPIIPHGSGPYSYHFIASQPNPPLCEYVATSPDGRSIQPVFGNLFTGEPLPKDGRLTIGTAPGFGMELADRSMLVVCG